MCGPVRPSAVTCEQLQTHPDFPSRGGGGGWNKS
jgi:hypothetical protein